MNDWVAVLECGHLAATDKYTVKAVRCGRCRGTWREVREWSPGYAVQCRTCRYARRFGAARVTALRYMSGHARKHPTHVVETWLGSAVVDANTPQTETLESATEPPF